jgi:4-hydroxy-3-polyprenylbenzoate decarboxylase
MNNENAISQNQPWNYVVAITGASGAPYARRLLHSLASPDIQIHVVASNAGKMVYQMEMGTSVEEDLPPGTMLYDETDVAAPLASGSFPIEAMVVVPCSMGSLAAIAQGCARNLIHRAADVCLKERRRLILVPREMPLSRIHLSNMLKVVDAGGIILPPMPGFYHQPQSVDDLLDFVVARILMQLGFAQNLVPPWLGGNS